MYSFIISIAVILYSVILVDFSLLFNDIALNNDVMSSAQAFYTAEGVIEKSLAESKSDVSGRIRNFLETKEDLRISENFFNEYNSGATAGYLNLKLGLNESDLLASEGFSPQNQAVKEGVYLAKGELLDRQSIYGLEPRSFKSFAVREVQNENNFNQIEFDYNLSSESSDLSFEIFAFPKEGATINFQKFQDLKDDLNENIVSRVVINTSDPQMNNKRFLFSNGRQFNVNLGSGSGSYKNKISITGFEPTGPNGSNYIFQFQTLDNQPIHYKMSAFYQAKLVTLPNVMQTIDVIGATGNGLYQRVKFQKETEEGVLPGLNFVHFSNQSIHK